MLFEFLATFTNYFNVVDLFTDIIFLSQTQESVENGKLDIFLLSTIFNTSFFVINVFLIQVKTIFNINISANDFKTTSNITRPDSLADPADIRVTEIGIYDNDNALVMIGKLSKPVKLTTGNTVMLELAIDF